MVVEASAVFLINDLDVLQDPAVQEIEDLRADVRLPFQKSLMQFVYFFYVDVMLLNVARRVGVVEFFEILLFLAEMKFDVGLQVIDRLLKQSRIVIESVLQVIQDGKQFLMLRVDQFDADAV